MKRPFWRLAAAALVSMAFAVSLGSTSATGAALPDNYVALGDSYSSGVGTSSYTLDASCKRSTYAYPYLLAQQRANTSLNFVACAGATTDDVINNQISALNSSTTIITISVNASLDDVATSGAILTQLNASIQNVNQALGKLGSQAKQIDSHKDFVSKLTDTLQTGVGNLVDADLAKESAHLQALQVQQQLGTQALSIANQAPQMILQLFKG